MGVKTDLQSVMEAKWADLGQHRKTQPVAEPQSRPILSPTN